MIELDDKIRQEVFTYSLSKLNEEFCKECNLRKLVGYIIEDTLHKIKYCFSESTLKRKPKNWNNCRIIKIQKQYPNFILDGTLFTRLLNIQWDIFKQLGGSYTNILDEPFQATYLRHRLISIRLVKFFGGSENLHFYIKKVNDIFKQ